MGFPDSSSGKESTCKCKRPQFHPWVRKFPWRRDRLPTLVQPVHPKDQSWVFTGRTDVEAETPILQPPDEELTHWKRPWCWERLRAGGEGDDRGWDGWMASSTRWTWVWVDSGSWWWTGRSAVHGVTKSWAWLSDWTEMNWTYSSILGLPLWLSW